MTIIVDNGPAKIAALPDGVRITASIPPDFAEILSFEALALVAKLHRKFEGRRRELINRRAAYQAKLDAGERPDFLAETAEIRAGDWTVAAIPADLQDRRVEITGPTDRKMVINALNSGANVFMADFEDSATPTWENMVVGQINLRDAVRRTITYTDPKSAKRYALGETPAVLIARPRGWHLLEKHVLVDGEPVSGGLFDFALYFHHNAKALVERGSGPYFYLPKIESHHEARLWNDVFVLAQQTVGVPQGTIKGTVLIETILAAFEMDEILYELRAHAAGLNCGRWDYIFSFIKKFRAQPDFVLPDRSSVTMTKHFLTSYSLLLIKTCHRRRAFAMGGMAAQIPIKSDPVANQAALDKVREDKLREARNGHDGTWVAHPGLVGIAKEVFDAAMPGANQLDNLRQDVDVTAADLLAVPEGMVTEAGMRQNINVGVLYTESWLRGQGCVPLYNLMEDAATAEISRTQVWQWVHHGTRLDDGTLIDAGLFERMLDQEMAKIEQSVGGEVYASGRYDQAAVLFRDLIQADLLAEFLTLPAYDQIVQQGA